MNRYLFKRSFVLLLLLSAVVLNSYLPASAQPGKAAFTDSVLIAKNFPLLSLLKQNGGLQTLIQKDKVFKKTMEVQHKRIRQGLQKCNSVSCVADSLKWTEKEITINGDKLIEFYKRSERFRKIISVLRRRGSYALYEISPDTVLLRNAWRDAAKGINRIFDIYIKGEKPHYVNIDSISFSKGDIKFEKEVRNSLVRLLQKNDKNVFFGLPLQVALSVLTINGRDEAARYEPLNKGLNLQPFLRVKSTRFSAYTYSVILVPGLGPETPGVALDPRGAKRCEEAVIRFRKGLAPFIVVSGGHVHPFKTAFNEAVEMKKYMVEQLGVPADVIFIEPHARHTTTNLRNTCRMIFHFGLPVDKPVLIVTDSSQSSYIVSRMGKTAIQDFGYEPYKNLKKLTEDETEFYPIRISLQADPFDPMDP